MFSHPEALILFNNINGSKRRREISIGLEIREVDMRER